MNIKFIGFLLAVFLVSICSWAESPEWIKQTGRQVISGDIIHWGTGSDSSPDIAIFKARQMAIKTMIEECGGVAISIIPRKQYVESDRSFFTAYALVSLDFQSCEDAKGPNGKKLENPEIREAQNTYKKIIFSDKKTEITIIHKSDEDLTSVKEAQQKIQSDIQEDVENRDYQIQELKNEMAAMKLRMVTPTQPVRLPATNSMKIMCESQYQNMMMALTLHSSAYNGNMADPALGNELGAAMVQKQMCQRLE